MTARTAVAQKPLEQASGSTSGKRSGRHGVRWQAVQAALVSNVDSAGTGKRGIRARLFRGWTGVDLLSPTATMALIMITFLLLLLVTFGGSRSGDMFDGTR